MMNETIILFGSSSGIAKAYIEELNNQNKSLQVICLSRTPNEHTIYENLKLSHYETDYSKESLSKITQKINLTNSFVSQVIIFNGQLHMENKMPERKLSELDYDYFNGLMNSNALIPMLCLASVMPLLDKTQKCTIIALSARVGSLGDNKLGGWYSYRASKAALNMLFTSAAIEISRKSKNTKLILFHPGTTNTKLSKPFQKNVPDGKLFTAEFVAKQLFKIQNNNFNGQPSSEVAFLDWKAEPIPW
ncbi:SDR family NAD(P)-dependent oxidoreductase [Marinomonas algicola]|uniref:SDR family NAD(P)-dependent oxidoreductase n=1 Tax=Marinomonas algicola TaxID=2773454 RepID=UPI0019D508D9|nr:SDR family NAD(P)-dependent oxidoreductase [Marinomonas algicola]